MKFAKNDKIIKINSFQNENNDFVVDHFESLIDQLEESYDNVNLSVDRNNSIKRVIFELIKKLNAQSGFLLLKGENKKLRLFSNVNNKGNSFPVSEKKVITEIVAEAYELAETKYIYNNLGQTNYSTTLTVASPMFSGRHLKGILLLKEISNNENLGRTLNLINLTASYISSILQFFDSEKDKRKISADYDILSKHHFDSARSKLNFVSSPSEFIRMLSHELRTPLNIIDLSLEIVFSQIKELKEDSIDDINEMIKNSQKRLLNCVENLVTISQIENNGIEAIKDYCNLKNDIILPIVSSIKEDVKNKNNKISVLDNSDSNLIFVDQELIRKSLSCIINNANKFTRDGRITISLKTGRDSSLICEVEDTGIGMSEEFRQRLFTPFLQESNGISRQYEGLGLELTITKNILELNNASIEVYSTKGKGSIFRITFQK